MKTYTQNKYKYNYVPKYMHTHTQYMHVHTHMLKIYICASVNMQQIMLFKVLAYAKL